MRRMLALGLALLALVAAGFLWTRDRPVAVALPAPMPVADAADPEAAEPEAALIAPKSNVTPAEREARRFGRYDKDHDDRISRDEFLGNRRKAFAKLDINGDGRLSVEEFAAATVKKFGKADRNADGVLLATEFATTARKTRVRTGPPCVPAEN